MKKEKLLVNAKRVIKNSHSPYSNYTVGAALVTKDNKMFLGCNVENAGIQSICAERVAFANAVANGYKDFKEILVIGKNKNDKYLIETLPCGYCRQFMCEFCYKDFKIITYNEENKEFKEYRLEELLPYNFNL